MAGSDLWVRVQWRHGARRLSFLVKSVHTGRTDEFTSESVANAVLCRDDELDNADFAASREARVLEGVAESGEVATETTQVFVTLLDDGLPLFFGVGEDGSLITGISLVSSEVEVALDDSPGHQP